MSKNNRTHALETSRTLRAALKDLLDHAPETLVAMVPGAQDERRIVLTLSLEDANRVAARIVRRRPQRCGTSAKNHPKCAGSAAMGSDHCTCR